MKLLICGVIFMVAVHVECEMFSSTDELARLEGNQDVVIEEINGLIEGLEMRVKEIKKTLLYNEKTGKLYSIKVEHSKMTKNPQKYVEVPLNSFLLIKSLSYDVEEIQNNLQNVLEDFTKGVKEQQLPISDFKGAIEGLHRIHMNYELKCEDLAEGIIDGVKYRRKLSSDDLFSIGSEILPHDKDLAECYLKIALKEAEDHRKIEIYQKLLEIYSLSEKNEKILEVYEKMIEIDPDSEDLESARVEIELDLLFGEKKPSPTKDSTTDQLSGTHKTLLKEQKILAQSCMGKRLQNVSTTSTLYCRYHSTNFFTKIAPFKLEIANVLPFVGIFHDAISDKEIEHFKSIAESKLRRAEVISTQSKSVVSTNRVAKLGFLYEIYDETKVLEKVHTRVGDMSGLSMKTAESWQVQNYGIGGHYNLHHDFTFEGQDFNLGTGNRILTALFYLSNVEKGGATVFPFLRLHVPPKKGTAVVWHNLSTSGNREYLTLHAACPVLIGSKWVANKWLHEYGQEWSRPCELHPMPTEDHFDQKYWIL